VRQRYPAAGTANTAVELKVVELNGGTANVDLGGDRNIYVARVDWFPSSQHLAVQRETRNQQRLDLLKVDAHTGQSRTLLTGASSTWIHLDDNIAFVPQRHAFVWASERSGFRHLYLYDENGESVRPLTAGSWNVTKEIDSDHVDASRGLIFFTANEATPLE